jgi:hypothetical protein
LRDFLNVLCQFRTRRFCLCEKKDIGPEDCTEKGPRIAPNARYTESQKKLAADRFPVAQSNKREPAKPAPSADSSLV